MTTQQDKECRILQKITLTGVDRSNYHIVINWSDDTAQGVLINDLSAHSVRLALIEHIRMIDEKISSDVL